MPNSNQEPVIMVEIKGENLNYSQKITPSVASELISYLVSGGQVVKKTSSTKKTRIRAEKSKNDTNIAKELGISSDGSSFGLPNYYKLGKKSDKILWILAYVSKAAKIDALSAGEISSIASYIQDHIQAKHVGTLLSGSKNNGRIDPSGGKFRILKPGIDYVESLALSEKK